MTTTRSGAHAGTDGSGGRDEPDGEGAVDAVEDAAEHAADRAIHGGGDAPSHDLPAGVRRLAGVLGAVGTLAAPSPSAPWACCSPSPRCAVTRPASAASTWSCARWAPWQGVAPLLILSAGLAAFGCYGVLDARYRRAG